LFVDALIERLSARYGKSVHGVSDRAMQALMAYHWPGNIRELENVLERGVLLAQPGSRIDREALFVNPAPNAAGNAFVDPHGQVRPRGSDGAAAIAAQAGDLTLARHEAALVDEAMRRASGNVSEAARLLGLTRRQLDYRLKCEHKPSGDDLPHLAI
jgi:transcriptional regulator with PAS, ATPase and Fis domain